LKISGRRRRKRRLEIREKEEEEEDQEGEEEILGGSRWIWLDFALLCLRSQKLSFSSESGGRERDREWESEKGGREARLTTLRNVSFTRGEGRKPKREKEGERIRTEARRGGEGEREERRMVHYEK
jgi:hypothetical protein